MAMTTLADMTPEERLDSIGMWATVDTEQFLAVIVRTYANDDVTYAQMLAPEIMDYYTSSLVAITPRFDLPRAWRADGTPPAGGWETGKVKIIPNENAKYDPERNVITGDAVVDLDHEPRDSHDIRRWVGSWEEV